MSMADTSTVSPAAAPNHISWVSPPEGFLGLSLLNGLLRIVTLGVYHFWGKTEVRQRIWSAVMIKMFGCLDKKRPAWGVFPVVKAGLDRMN